MTVAFLTPLVAIESSRATTSAVVISCHRVVGERMMMPLAAAAAAAAAASRLPLPLPPRVAAALTARLSEEEAMRREGRRLDVFERDA